MDDFEKELKTGFLEEAAQALADTEQCFLNLETAKDDPSIVEKIFRLAHNLKGSARAVGFEDMGHFTHQLESLLLKIKNKEIDIHSQTITLLLKANDHLQLMISILKGDLNGKVDSSELLNEIQAQLSGQQIAPVQKTTQPAIENKTTELEKNEEVSIDQSQPTVELSFNKKATSVTAPQQVDESIRVNLKKLENLLNNVGEMVILQTVLNQQKNQIPSPLLQKTIVQLSKISKNIQEITMSLRMLPLKQTFQKMQRIVRDTAVAVNKNVQLNLSGEDTELDKTVIDMIGDPLVHLIRNAVDHGIESTEDRVAKGKSEIGSIALQAYHQGGHIIIEVRDDGKGLDAEKLKSKAIEKGILKPNQVLSEQDAYQLIFAPGFSTKAEVTDISGRGVGLDVVKTNIESLQGDVQIQTELGKGTCFRIQLPLTLAIIEGLVIKSSEERYVLPLSQMNESLSPGKNDIHHVSGMGETLTLRGEVMPLFRLNQLLGKRSSDKHTQDSIAIVVRGNAKPFSILVDDIIGQQQVVSKRLGQELSSLKGITGGAILGDGRAALILDFFELVNNSSRPSPTLMRGVA